MPPDGFPVLIWSISYKQGDVFSLKHLWYYSWMKKDRVSNFGHTKQNDNGIYI